MLARTGDPTRFVNEVDNPLGGPASRDVERCSRPYVGYLGASVAKDRRRSSTASMVSSGSAQVVIATSKQASDACTSVCARSTARSPGESLLHERGEQTRPQ